ncbi:MAG: hypothetical protein WC002_05765, partial [Candidatus Muiribacteriota bacterium]
EITINISVDETAESGTTPEGILIIAARKTDTMTRLKNGETVVMGGLISRKESVSRRNVPVVSRLPLVGKFFRQRERVDESNEMVIFMSAYLVDEDEEMTATGVNTASAGSGQQDNFSNVVNELRYRLGNQ